MTGGRGEGGGGRGRGEGGWGEGGGGRGGRGERGGGVWVRLTRGLQGDSQYSRYLDDKCMGSSKNDVMPEMGEGGGGKGGGGFGSA